MQTVVLISISLQVYDAVVAGYLPAIKHKTSNQYKVLQDTCMPLSIPMEAM